MDFFFEKATSSDATNWWYGERNGDVIPDKQAFFDDFEKYYFQDEQNRKGRCFHIIKQGKKIGQVNYNEIIDDQVELDIIIYDKENWSKGYGTSAIKLLTAYLEEKYHIDSSWIEVHPENKRAKKAYQKAGFSFLKDFEENGIQWARFSKPNRFKNN